MPSAQGRPIVGVSAFGASGTNVHVVLGGAPEPEPVAEPRERKAAHLIPISARSDAALRALAKKYREVLTAEPPADAAYTASCGRNHFAHRLALVGDSPEQLCARIDAFLAGPSGGGDEPEGLAAGVVESAAPPRVAFLFTGQVSQYAGMGRELARREPVFREALGALRGNSRRPARQARCAKFSTMRAIARPDRARPAGPHRAGVGAGRAVARVGIGPAAVLGHSVGEYAAACVAA
jgi:acyl transferase domain-containing protein